LRIGEHHASPYQPVVVRVELAQAGERLSVGQSSLFEQVVGLILEMGQIGVSRQRLNGHHESPSVTPVVRRSG
jgi:hypothetical protein